MRPVAWEVCSYIGIWVKCKCWPGTASGLSLGKRVCFVLGNARRRDRNSRTSPTGVPKLVNSSSVRFSTRTFLPSWMDSSSCMWKPNHIWLSMSIPRVAARLDLELDGVGVGLLGILEVAVKSSAFLLLEVWLADASSIRGWRCWSAWGVLSMMRADLCDMACGAWIEWRSKDPWMKLPPCSGDTFSSASSMSKSKSSSTSC